MTRPARELSAETMASLLVDTSPYLSCDDCFAQIDTYVERRAADPHFDDPRMAAHLAGCGACREEAAALMELLGHDGAT